METKYILLLCNVTNVYNRDLNDYPNIKLKIDGQLLKPVTNAKFLGLHFDYKLDWHVHTKNVQKKLSSALYLLNSVKHILPSKHLKCLYYSMFHSYMSYGLLLWGSAKKTYLHPLEIKQNKAIRAIAHAKYNAHAEPLYVSLTIPKLCNLKKIETCRFMYNHSLKNLPPPLMTFFIANTYIHEHQTRHRNDPHITRRYTQAMASNFVRKGPELWVGLPPDIKLSKSENSFKRSIKKYFTK